MAAGDDIALPTLSLPQERDFTPSDSQDVTGHFSDTSDTSTATNSSDQFDWDHDDNTAKAAMDTKAKRGRALYLAFMKLARPFRVLLIGILGTGIFITPLIVVELKFKSNKVRPQVHAWSMWLSIIWAAACITYLIVDSIPRMIISLIVLFGGHVERLKTQLELILAVSGWLKLALDVSWAWIALGVIRAFYKPDGQYWFHLNHVMQALFSASVILLVEKIFLQFVAISFHRKALADRLAENHLGLKALDRLSNAQLYVRKGHKSRPGSYDFLGFMGGHKSTHHDHVDHNADDRRESTIGSLDRGEEKPKKQGHGRKRSEYAERKQKRKKAMASIIVDQVGNAIGQVTLKNSKFNRDGEMGGLSSARKLARKLFGALSDVTPHKSRLVVEDFYPYFRTTAEAHAAFALFDKDGNGDINKKEMRDAVQRIYRERKSLVASLKDVSSAVGKLDAVLVAVALMFIVFICLFIFNRSNTLASLVPFATIILGFSFIFGHSAQTLFESLIFIFSTHVFDVGDLVMIDDQPLFVREFGLFSTTFRRVDGQEIIAPNALLSSTKLVHNMRRSNSMWETTNLMVSYNTPLDVLEELKNRLRSYITENSREWAGFDFNIDKMEFQNAIWLIIAIQHRPNWQDWGGRWGRRTAFMRFLKITMEELDVKYSMPLQPILMPNRPTFANRESSPKSPRFEPTHRTSAGIAGKTTWESLGSFQGSSTLNRAPTRGLRPGDSSF